MSLAWSDCRPFENARVLFYVEFAKPKKIHLKHTKDRAWIYLIVSVVEEICKRMVSSWRVVEFNGGVRLVQTGEHGDVWLVMATKGTYCYEIFAKNKKMNAARFSIDS